MDINICLFFNKFTGRCELQVDERTHQGLTDAETSQGREVDAAGAGEHVAVSS